jgi:hypothetical protein
MDNNNNNNNITMEQVEKDQSDMSDTVPQQQQQHQVNLASIEVKDENIALNLMVSFLQLGHKRGAYSLEESSKIWECVKMFVKAE